MKNRYGSYDDYNQESIELDREEAQRDAHDNGICEGIPFCMVCLEQRDIDDMADHVNKELDKDERRADEHHERYEEMMRQRKQRA